MTRCSCKDSVNVKSSVYNQTGQDYIEQISIHRSMCAHVHRILLAKSVVDSRNTRYVRAMQKRCCRPFNCKPVPLSTCPSIDTIDRLTAYELERQPVNRSKSTSKERGRSVDRKLSGADSNCSCVGNAKPITKKPPQKSPQKQPNYKVHTCNEKQSVPDSKPDEILGRINKSSVVRRRRSCDEEQQSQPQQQQQQQQQKKQQPQKPCGPTPRPSSTGKCDDDCGGRKLVERECEEALYAKFVYDITQEIVQNGLYTDFELKEIFQKHIDRNIDQLNKRKMLYEIYQLKISLNMLDDSEDEDEVEANLVYAENFPNQRMPKPPTPPKVLNENKVIEKLQRLQEMKESGNQNMVSPPGRKCVLLMDANPEFLVTEQDVLSSLMENDVSPEQIQRIYKNLYQRSKDMTLCEAVQVGSEVAYTHRLKQVDRSSSAASFSSIHGKDKTHGILRKESKDYSIKLMSTESPQHRYSYLTNKQSEALSKYREHRTDITCKCKKQPCTHCKLQDRIRCGNVDYVIVDPDCMKKITEREEPEVKLEPKPKPIPIPEPESESESEPEPEPKPKPKPKSKPESKPEPEREPKGQKFYKDFYESLPSTLSTPTIDAAESATDEKAFKSKDIRVREFARSSEEKPIKPAITPMGSRNRPHNEVSEGIRKHEFRKRAKSKEFRVSEDSSDTPESFINERRWSRLSRRSVRSIAEIHTNPVTHESDKANRDSQGGSLASDQVARTSAESSASHKNETRQNEEQRKDNEQHKDEEQHKNAEHHKKKREKHKNGEPRKNKESAERNEKSVVLQEMSVESDEIDEEIEQDDDFDFKTSSSEHPSDDDDNNAVMFEEPNSKTTTKHKGVSESDRYSDDFSTFSEASSMLTATMPQSKAQPEEDPPTYKGKVSNRQYTAMREYQDEQTVWQISEGSADSTSVSSTSIPSRMNELTEMPEDFSDVIKKRLSTGASGLKVMDSWNTRMSEFNTDAFAAAQVKFCDNDCRGNAIGPSPCSETCKYLQSGCRTVKTSAKCMSTVKGDRSKKK